MYLFISCENKEEKYLGSTGDFRYSENLDDIKRKVKSYHTKHYKSFYKELNSYHLDFVKTIYDNRILCLDVNGNSIGAIIGLK